MHQRDDWNVWKRSFRSFAASAASRVATNALAVDRGLGGLAVQPICERLTERDAADLQRIPTVVVRKSAVEQSADG